MDHTTIPLGQGRVTIVDAEDYEWLRKKKWCSNGRYAHRRKGKKREWMHRTILEHHGADLLGLQGDHINNDSFDNRKSNLRVATRAGNHRNRRKNVNNTSGYTGVTWKKEKQKWVARIHSKERIYLGEFTDKLEAARAYDRAAIKYHGDFASLNFPRSDYD